MSKKTACPLDCFDACEIIYDGKIKASKEHPYTQGYLCPHLNHYEENNFITQARYKGENISIERALEILKEKLESTDKIKTLQYRGHGNFGLMQDSMNHFFASYGATLTDGTLCDGAGEAGILEGRGANRLLNPTEIAKSDVVVLWGRNIETTSSHLMPFLKNKEIIVVDPYETSMVHKAVQHVKLKPHSDIYFAMMLYRFVMIENMFDQEHLDEFASEYEEFYDMTQTIRIRAVLEKIDLSLGDIGEFLENIRGKKVSIIVGVGAQKYRNGDEVLRAIDAFAMLMGFFHKEGCGVGYLASSRQGIESPFIEKAKRVSVVDTKFSAYDLVFVQGANPLNQMPDTNRVEKELDKVKELIYFGLFENETSAKADLVIPALNFLYKNDVRVSYGNDALLDMPAQKSSEDGISEYKLAHYLCTAFDIELQSEESYLNHFRSFGEKRKGYTAVKSKKTLPYEGEFETDDGEFLFLDEVDFDMELENVLFLLTSKSKRSLNSQFKRETNVYVHPSLGFIEGQSLEISSVNGSVILEVAHDSALREDCILIYSGTAGVNRLSSSKKSYVGNSAAYQENRVKVKIC